MKDLSRSVAPQRQHGLGAALPSVGLGGAGAGRASNCCLLLFVLRLSNRLNAVENTLMVAAPSANQAGVVGSLG